MAETGANEAAGPLRRKISHWVNIGKNGGSAIFKKSGKDSMKNAGSCADRKVVVYTFFQRLEHTESCAFHVHVSCLKVKSLVNADFQLNWPAPMAAVCDFDHGEGSKSGLFRFS